MGLILASGGVDGTIKIWRQPSSSSESHKSKQKGGNPHSTKGSLPTNWINVATLTEPRGTVRSLGFAPSEFGLKLAAVSSDSRLRIWECLDPVKSQDWSLLEEIDLNNLPTSNNNTNSSGFSSNNLNGEGGASTSQGSSNNQNQSTSGSSSIDGTGGRQQFKGGNSGGGTVESDGGWSLSWCREHWWGERLAVSSGTNGIIRVSSAFLFTVFLAHRTDCVESVILQLFHLPSHAPWSNFLTLYPTRQTLSSSSPSSSSSESLPHLAPTCSLNWAPPSGRSYQLLASGSKDSKVRVYKIFPPSLQSTSGGLNSLGDGEWTAQLDVELDESSKKPVGGGGSANGSILNGGGGGQQGGGSSTPNSSGANQQNALGGGGAGAIGATKVEWNVTGTVLSTSGGEDGKVRLWKCTSFSRFPSFCF